jgi:hypothetical protein
MSDTPVAGPDKILSKEEESQTSIETKPEIVDAVVKEQPTFTVYKPSNVTSPAPARECV